MGLNTSCCFSQDISKNIVGVILLVMVLIRNTEYSQITCYFSFIQKETGVKKVLRLFGVGRIL